MKLLQRLKNLFLPEGEISDGFHSFDEVIDELDPVDNNGSPTREIYNDKDELMWHNAELVNRGEIITQSIRSISKENYER